MNASEWTATTRLNEAGFAVSYCRISYSSENPLWRASAQRAEKKWITLGADLEATLMELEKQTQETIPDWREMKKSAVHNRIVTCVWNEMRCKMHLSL